MRRNLSAVLYQLIRKNKSMTTRELADALNIRPLQNISGRMIKMRERGIVSYDATTRKWAAIGGDAFFYGQGQERERNPHAGITAEDLEWMRNVGGVRRKFHD
jgi:transcriptional regulator with XRE-family HTH domain